MAEIHAFGLKFFGIMYRVSFILIKKILHITVAVQKT